MDTVCCPLFLTPTCSSNIFSHFLDLFDILGSPQCTSSSYIHHLSRPVLSSFTEPTATSPSSLLAGFPAEDHCLRSEGPLIAGWGARGGVGWINPTDSNIWFPLCLMTMLAFHMQPNKLDQICGIDREEGQLGPWQHGHLCTTVQYTNTQGIPSTHSLIQDIS